MLSLGPLSVTVYSLAIAGAALLSGLLLCLLLRGKGEDPLGLFLLTGLGALLGARLVYCLATLPTILADYGGIGFFLRLWQGGFALPGAFWGGTLAAFLYEKHRGTSLKPVAAPLLACGFLTLMIARIAEISTLQGLGDMVEEEGLQFFPFAVWSEYQYTWCIPVFFWEALAALAGLVFLLLRRKAPGAALQGIGWLCASQILLESLREDDCIRFGFTRFGQLACVVTLLGILIARLVLRKSKGKEALCRLLGFLLLAGVMVGIEFALDRTDLSHLLLYLVMALALVGMYLVSIGKFREQKER